MCLENVYLPFMWVGKLSCSLLVLRNLSILEVLNFLKRFYVFTFREKGMKGESEGEKH